MIRPSPPSPTDLLALAATLATSASSIVREGARANKFTVATKSTATDPVTEIDKASEAHIVSELLAVRPDDGVVGEEGATIESKSGVTWVIDPIDGTTNFVFGIPSYAVSIGVVVDDLPVAGAVYNPALDELFTAAVGDGAFLNGESIRVNETENLGEALVATGFSYSSEVREKQGQILAALIPRIRDVRRMGAAALDICNVACGRVDAYYETRVWPWDVTGAYVIAKEAGATATGFDGGIPKRNAVVACTPSLHATLLPIASSVD